jgi:hypothetical protein
LLFADDACSLHSDKNLNELILKVNSELQKIANWFSANKLVVNVNKCKYIIFHTKGKKLNLEGLDVYFNLNEIGKNQSPEKIITLERVGSDQKEKNYKYLGVLIDEHLNFNDNTDYLCNKLAKAVFQLRKAKFYVTKKHLLTLYHALFNSHLWYCTIILSCTSQANLNRILILQKKAIRVVANLDYNAHTASTFSELKLLQFDKLIIYHQLTFMHAIKFNYAPISFVNMWQTFNERENAYNLRELTDFILPAPRFEGYRKFPLYSLAKKWNEFDVNIRLQPNPVTFKIELKRHLLGILRNTLTAAWPTSFVLLPL